MIGLLSWHRLDACHGIDWILVTGSIGFPKTTLDEQFGIGLVAYDWTLAMESCHGMIGLLSWNGVDSCQGVEWTLVMGSMGVLS